jgi:hypothetical protein
MPSPGMQGQPVYLPQQPVVPRDQLSQPYAQVPRQPVVRGSTPEEKKPVRSAPVTLPPPEKLGILPPPAQFGITPAQETAQAGSVDWNATHVRMKTMGVLSYTMERPPEGGWRFGVVMATAEAGRTYRIDGAGATEADAVRSCLDKTERWLKQIP